MDIYDNVQSITENNTQNSLHEVQNGQEHLPLSEKFQEELDQVHEPSSSSQLQNGSLDGQDYLKSQILNVDSQSQQMEIPNDNDSENRLSITENQNVNNSHSVVNRNEEGDDSEPETGGEFSFQSQILNTSPSQSEESLSLDSQKSSSSISNSQQHQNIQVQTPEISQSQSEKQKLANLPGQQSSKSNSKSQKPQNLQVRTSEISQSSKVCQRSEVSQSQNPKHPHSQSHKSSNSNSKQRPNLQVQTVEISQTSEISQSKSQNRKRNNLPSPEHSTSKSHREDNLQADRSRNGSVISSSDPSLNQLVHNFECLHSQLLSLQDSESQRNGNSVLTPALYLQSQILNPQPDQSDNNINITTASSIGNFFSQPQDTPLNQSSSSSLNTQDFDALIDELPQPQPKNYNKVNVIIKTERFDDDEPRVKRLCDVHSVEDVFNLKCTVINTFLDLPTSIDEEVLEDDVGYIIVEDGTMPNFKFKIPKEDPSRDTMTQTPQFSVDNPKSCFIKVYNYSNIIPVAVPGAELTLPSVKVKMTDEGQCQLVMDGRHYGMVSRITPTEKDRNAQLPLLEDDSETVIVPNNRTRQERDESSSSVEDSGRVNANDTTLKTPHEKVNSASNDEESHTSDDSDATTSICGISKITLRRAKVPLDYLSKSSKSVKRKKSSKSAKHKSKPVEEFSDDENNEVLRRKYGITNCYVLLERELSDSSSGSSGSSSKFG